MMGNPQKTKSKQKTEDSRNHRVYRRFIDDQEVFLCRDCWSKERPMDAVVPFGHGELQ